MSAAKTTLALMALVGGLVCCGTAVKNVVDNHYLKPDDHKNTSFPLTGSMAFLFVARSLITRRSSISDKKRDIQSRIDRWHALPPDPEP